MDQDVFIRSLGARGGFGGLSAATGAMAAVLEAAGFDIIIIETVGVGQTELQVMHLADGTVVVLVPESGDVIQTMKAGILEIADIFVVNKSDRPGADVLAHELRAMAEQEGEKSREVILTSTLKNSGIEEFAQNFQRLASELKPKRRVDSARKRGEFMGLMLWAMDQKFRKNFEKKKIANVYSVLTKIRLPKI